MIQMEGDRAGMEGEGGAGRYTRTPFFKSTLFHLLTKSFLQEARFGLLALLLRLLLKNLLDTHKSIVLCKSFHLYKKLHVSIDWQTRGPGGLQGSTGLAIQPFELDI
jgi:hypothetical protein